MVLSLSSFLLSESQAQANFDAEDEEDNKKEDNDINPITLRDRRLIRSLRVIVMTHSFLVVMNGAEVKMVMYMQILMMDL